MQGNSRIFFSFDQIFPSQNDFQHQIKSVNHQLVSLNSNHVSKIIKLQNKTLYLGVECADRCIFDFYFTVYDEKEKDDKIWLRESKTMKNQITKNNTVRRGFSIIYYQNFHFFVESDLQDSYRVEVNSENIDLLICIQLDQVRFNFEKGCDYSSSVGIVNLKHLDPYIDVAISVQKVKNIFA